MRGHPHFHRHRVPTILLLTLSLTLAACGSDPQRTIDTEPIPPLSVDEFRDMLETSDRPVLVTVWASWCGPCRSEAPLLRQAHEVYGDRIRFVGIDVKDVQGPAVDFLSEFGIAYENFFDPKGAFPASLGGFGVPLTYFFAAGGEQVFLQPGVIDDRTLALQIDDGRLCWQSQPQCGPPGFSSDVVWLPTRLGLVTGSSAPHWRVFSLGG